MSGIHIKVLKPLKLKKCLHGITQHYEGLNALIWKRCPKNIYVGLTVLAIGTASAVTNFNHGMAGILKVLAKLDVIPGSNSINCCNKRDKDRIYQMNRKEMDFVKHQRKQI